MNEEKQSLRRIIAQQKQEYPTDILDKWSAQIMNKLEQTPLFQKAQTIACYYAIHGEVQTRSFIEKWYEKKQIALPVVQGHDLQFSLYAGKESMQIGAFGIWEPRITAGSSSIEQQFDLVIVPGVAFDRKKNRLGRGKGFYDRLLSTLNVPAVGICFDFQLRNELPIEPFDRKMDLIITERSIIG